MTSRSWRWLQTRIVGLLDRPIVTYDAAGDPLYPTRLQRALFKQAPAGASLRTHG